MFFISGFVTIIIITFALLASAPPGHEDENGFHYDFAEQGKPRTFLTVVAIAILCLSIGLMVGGAVAWAICGR